MKLRKPIALFLAASIMLTSCSNNNNESGSKGFFEAFGSNNSNQDVDNSGSVFENEPVGEVTNVSDEPYTFNGKEGKYTGEWQNDHPHGSGKFTVSDEEYCEGEWRNGQPRGNVTFVTPLSEGSSKKYEGIYADNNPAGEGKMHIEYANDCGYCDIEGDFSNYSSLSWQSFDRDGFPENMGTVNNEGSLVSYENSTTGGIERKENGIPAYQMDRALHGGSAWCKYFYFSGQYYGPTNESGEPDGYGYFTGTPHWLNHYESDDGSMVFLDEEYNGQFETEEYAKDHYAYIYISDAESIVGKANAKLFGKWENGRLIGKYYLSYYFAETNEEIEKVCTELDREGNEVGNNITVKLSYSDYTEYGVEFMRNKSANKACTMTVKKGSADGFRNYQPDSSGVYCCPGYTQDDYYADGTFATYSVYCYLQDSSDINSWKYTGQYCKYDEDGNKTEEGLYYDGEWMTYEELDRRFKAAEKKKHEQALFYSALAIAGVAIVSWMIYDAKRFNEKIEQRKVIQQQAMANESQRQSLIDQGRYEEASSIPIICVPSALDCI